VIPEKIKNDFLDLVKEYHLDEKLFSLRILEADPSYIKILPTAATKNMIVSIITSLFNKGFINILSGTQALLGEGWDAPSINSLILSSTVSSYMLSNQMRGRAIRTDKNNPEKIANIWHLASVKKLNLAEMFKAAAPQSMTNAEELEQQDYSYDFYKVAQRFECFEGPSYKKPYSVESGITRLGINPQEILDENIVQANRNAVLLACDRNNTKKSWEEALIDPYSGASVRRGLEISEKKGNEKIDTLIFNATIKYTAGFYLTISIIVLSLFSRFGITGFLISFFVFAALMARPAYKYILSGSIEGTLKQVTRCVLESLYAADVIKSNLITIGISVQNLGNGAYFFCLSNVTVEENNQILKAVRQVLDPIENPRYIIERHGLLFERFRTVDYHAVPEIFEKNAHSTALFEKLWKKYVSPAKLIYTRSIEGRRILLKARKKAFSGQFRKNKIKNISKWA
jgi:hypothetical protein